MKLITLSNNNINAPNLLNFYTDDEQSEKFYFIGQEVRIFEVKFIPNCIDGAFIKMEYLKVPQARPTKDIIKDNDMKSVYEDSNILNRQTLSIDPLFAAEFSEGNIESRAQHICWPKKYAFKQNIIAVVTNFGQCDIVEFNNVTRTYEKTLIATNDLFKEMFPRKVAGIKFKELNKLINDISITTCCWICSDKNILIFSTISGWIFAAEIKKDLTVQLISKTKTEFYKINRLKLFQFLNENNEYCNGILVSNINGLISLYKFESSGFKELCVLWTKEDKMSSKQFDIYFEAENQNLIITTIKGFHLLVFIVSVKTWNVIYKGNKFCNAKIANFQRLTTTSHDFIVSTMIGQTKLITLSNLEEKYVLESSEISNDLEIENYTLCGMVAIQNKISYIFIMYPEKNFILNRQKYPALVSFCYLDHFKPLEILKKYDRTYNNAKDFVDCYEIIRLQLTKNPNHDKIHLYDIKPITIDFNFLHRLRIRYNIISGIMAYNLKKTKSYNEIHELEINSIKLSIKAIYAFWRLTIIKRDITKLSDFQKLSAKNLQRMLVNYLKNIIFVENSSYDIIKEQLKDLSNETIALFGNVCKDILEICMFCNNNTDIENENCLHDIGRCCISYIQISSLKMKYCESCGDIAIDDVELLRQVMIDEHDMRCPMCDYILIE